MKVIVQVFQLFWLGVKYHFAWFVLHTVRREYLNREIVLISEKRREARDNGYYMFKFLREKKSEEVDAYYVLTKDSADYEKVNALGNVVNYNSFKHFLLFFGAKCLMYCQTDSTPNEEIRGRARYNYLRRKDQIRVYLTHGICKDDVESSYNYRKAGYHIFICGAVPEYNYYKELYDYPENNIALTGLCRYDGLIDYKVNQQRVLIMPTFRKWLRTSDSAKRIATEEECEIMQNSDFFKSYTSLLNNKQLESFLAANSITMLFYLHYTIQPYTELFRRNVKNQQVVVCGREDYDVQDLLKSSGILVTDYSSVAFDFAYMKKPVSYYQFDFDEYRNLHYKEGWFNYERDGLGPVFQDESDVLKWIMFKSLKPSMETCYEEKVLSFYEYFDDNNSERVYATYKKYRIANEKD